MFCGGCQAGRLARAAALADATRPTTARRRTVIRVRARGSSERGKI
jgi:hypothetical protein